MTTKSLSQLSSGLALKGNELLLMSQSQTSGGSLVSVTTTPSDVMVFVSSGFSGTFSSISSGLSNISTGLSNTNSSISAISSGLRLVTLNPQAGSYTFAATDVCTISNDVLVQATGSTGQTFTVPTNASVPIAVGGTILGEQDGTGQITIAGASGVTINTSSSLTTRAQYSSFVLIKKATNTWLLTGDLT